ncbi:Protein-tyrosine-phosphatase MKP1 [Porphyridium purpureum]|uniref:Protein-tyrosine-phosphatase MKP1 n=1 Tax=Porphyridium purpureum TaxID=35688 RepID=A0A5J4YWV2_PORPP|nr:Protein-tyrosine-phosphatase MKP1 [Porphyridium purpureum]|eukprot:POR2666..scf209_3
MESPVSTARYTAPRGTRRRWATGRLAGRRSARRGRVERGRARGQRLQSVLVPRQRAGDEERGRDRGDPQHRITQGETSETPDAHGLESQAGSRSYAHISASFSEALNLPRLPVDRCVDVAASHNSPQRSQYTDAQAANPVLSDYFRLWAYDADFDLKHAPHPLQVPSRASRWFAVACRYENCFDLDPSSVPVESSLLYEEVQRARTTLMKCFTAAPPHIETWPSSGSVRDRFALFLVDMENRNHSDEALQTSARALVAGEDMVASHFRNNQRDGAEGLILFIKACMVRNILTLLKAIPRDALQRSLDANIPLELSKYYSQHSSRDTPLTDRRALSLRNSSAARDQIALDLRGLEMNPPFADAAADLDLGRGPLDVRISRSISSMTSYSTSQRSQSSHSVRSARLASSLVFNHDCLSPLCAECDLFQNAPSSPSRRRTGGLPDITGRNGHEIPVPPSPTMRAFGGLGARSISLADSEPMSPRAKDRATVSAPFRSGAPAGSSSHGSASHVFGSIEPPSSPIITGSPRPRQFLDLDTSASRCDDGFSGEKGLPSGLPLSSARVARSRLLSGAAILSPLAKRFTVKDESDLLDGNEGEENSEEVDGSSEDGNASNDLFRLLSSSYSSDAGEHAFGDPASAPHGISTSPENVSLGSVSSSTASLSSKLVVKDGTSAVSSPSFSSSVPKTVRRGSLLTSVLLARDSVLSEPPGSPRVLAAIEHSREDGAPKKSSSEVFSLTEHHGGGHSHSGSMPELSGKRVSHEGHAVGADMVRTLSQSKYSEVKLSMQRSDSISKLNLGSVKNLAGLAEAPVTTPVQVTIDACHAVPSQVLPHLLVGSSVPARDLDLLRSKNVTHIINMCSLTEPDHFPGMFKYLSLKLTDSIDGDIGSLLLDICDFIDESQAASGTCYVHCHQGISRSCAAVICYLILRKGLTYEEAYASVMQARPIAAPNEGFVETLANLRGSLTAFDDMQLFRVEPYSSRDPGYFVARRLRDESRLRADETLCCIVAPPCAFVGRDYFVVLWTGRRANRDELYPHAMRACLQMVRQSKIALSFLSSNPAHHDVPSLREHLWASKGIDVGVIPENGVFDVAQDDEPWWLTALI